MADVLLLIMENAWRLTEETIPYTNEAEMEWHNYKPRRPVVSRELVAGGGKAYIPERYQEQCNSSNNVISDF